MFVFIENPGNRNVLGQIIEQCLSALFLKMAVLYYQNILVPV